MEIEWKILLIFIIFFFVLLKLANLSLFETKSLDRGYCKGVGNCFEGKMERIIDGDTFQINGKYIRLSLINTPEKGEEGFNESIFFINEICPKDSKVLVDEDGKQLARSHGRIVAVVYCGENYEINLNHALLAENYSSIINFYCNRSEFSDERWAKENGC